MYSEPMWVTVLSCCTEKLDNFQVLAFSVDNLYLSRKLYTGLLFDRTSLACVSICGSAGSIDLYQGQCGLCMPSL